MEARAYFLGGTNDGRHEISSQGFMHGGLYAQKNLAQEQERVG